jgi:apolipoprotein N-acyltransferase
VPLAAVAGVLHGCCFPPAGAWPLAFVALAPLVVAVRGASGMGGALLGWLAGTIAASIATTPWIAAATRQYFDQGPLAAVLFASLVGQVFHALPSALFGAAAVRVGRLDNAAARVLGAAACWTALELVRARVLTGAPWDLLGHALYAQPLWIQGAELGGVFVPSFVCAAAGAALAEPWCVGWRAARPGLASGALLVAALAAFGAQRLATEDDGGERIPVALVQGNVPNAWRADPAQADAALDAFASATRPVLARRPALVVWPENALSFLLEPNARIRSALAALLGPDGPPLLLGAPRFAQTEPGRVRFYNAAWLVGADGAPRAVYDKRRLVPFAEYAPVPRVPGLGWRFDAPGDYSPGVEAVVFPMPAPFGVLVCYEAIYPNLARDLTDAGARFLVNVSNDAWFGTSAGLEQHFAITVFRSVETRRALTRATNTGVTALVGPSGRILARFPPDVRDAWIVDVPLRDGATLYGRVGDVFAALCAVGAFVAVLAGRRT